MNSDIARRPILVWGIFLVHCLLAVYGVAYLLAALSLVPVGEQLSPRWSYFRWNDHLIALTWIVACCAGAYNLFFRKPLALVTYALGGLIYLLPNLARYVRACVDRGCPNFDYVVNVVAQALFFVVVAVLIIVALRSWPPLGVARGEA